MDNFLARAKSFVLANKTFVAVIVIGAILVFIALGGLNLKSISPLMPTQMLGRAGVSGGVSYSESMMRDASYGYAEKAGVVSSSIAPIPPIYNPSPSSPDLPSDKKIIQNGSLDLLVKNADD